jgi:isocitrate lyase
MGVPLVLVARTDAEAATLLDNNIDPRDHPFILGETANGKLVTFPDAVAEVLSNDAKALALWKSKAYQSSNADARALARELGVSFEWDWEKPRVREGYYVVKGGVDFCIARAKAFAPHADLIWMETSKPVYKDAEKFANAVHDAYPDQMLAYNLSPSFNWDDAGMSNQEIESYVDRLAELGFVWQFITLAGFHGTGLFADTFSKKFAQQKMLAYVTEIQRKERDGNVSTLTHQKWSGAELVDGLLGVATGGKSSTLAMGHGVTETQFKPQARL